MEPPAPLSPLPVTVYVSSSERSVHVKELPVVVQTPEVLEEPLRQQLDVKRWKGHRWVALGCEQRRRFDLLRKRFDEQLAGWHVKMCGTKLVDDTRSCILCRVVGDQQEAGRLLNLDVGRWLHVNCALWSHEVRVPYDRVLSILLYLQVHETAGALVNVEKALSNARLLSCTLCKEGYATLRCRLFPACERHYHFPCALKEGVQFHKDKVSDQRQSHSRFNF